MSDGEKQIVNKAVLSTGKVVLLRNFRIKHLELALKAVGNRAGKNEALHGMLASSELVKLLVVNIDGKDVNPREMEDLDSVFTMEEYGQIQSVVQQLRGGGGGEEQEVFRPKVETVSFGNK